MTHFVLGGTRFEVKTSNGWDLMKVLPKDTFFRLFNLPSDLLLHFSSFKKKDKL